jgi:hypothetical protein
LVPCTPVWVEWLGEVLKKLLNCSLRHWKMQRWAWD